MIMSAAGIVEIALAQEIRRRHRPVSDRRPLDEDRGEEPAAEQRPIGREYRSSPIVPAIASHSSTRTLQKWCPSS